MSGIPKPKKLVVVLNHIRAHHSKELELFLTANKDSLKLFYL
ncbi:MAG: hypothetical protein ACTSXH_10575 [Promethearchaeota archaeon]